MQATATQVIHPRHILGLVLKYRWLLIIPFCLSMLSGIYLELTLPRKYQANTLILVQPQKVPTNFVKSIVSSDIDSRISSISQQILSRTNLEKIIDEFKVFSGPGYEKMFPEDKIENLRKRIKVDVIKDRRRDADAFTISFKGEDPVRVMRIVNTLGTYFINENLKTREAQAIGTSDFLDDELVIMRKRLEGVEESLRQYRKKYMGELPEQLETNLRILDRIQAQMTGRQESLRDAKNSLVALNNRIQADRDLSLQSGSAQDGKVGLPGLIQLKEQLANLKAGYTDRHPDVIRLKSRIRDLEAQLEKKEKEPVKGQDKEVPGITRNVYDQNIIQRDEIKREVRILEDDIKKLQVQSKFYQKRVENTPKREQELLSLRRDYKNIKETYDSLLSRKLEAQIAVNMEKKQKGEQFRILDPARLPTKPVEPDMKKIFMLAVTIGLGIGAGLIFLLEYYDSSFKKVEDIESYLELPVLSTIPALYQPKDKRWHRVNLAMSSIFAVISIILFAGFALLTLNGVNQTLEFVNRFIRIQP